MHTDLVSEIKIITNVDEIDKKKWDEFVFNHPLGSIYQTPHIYDIFKNTKNYQPIVIFSKNNNKISGVLLAVEINEGAGIISNFTSRSIIIGGPLAIDNDEKILISLLSEYEKILSKKVIYTEIREIFELPFQSLLLKHGYQIEKRLNILVDLSKTEDELWYDMHPKRRNDIKRAEKRGITVKVIEEYDEIIESYEILKDVYKRAGLPLADRSLFINCFSNLYKNGYCKFLGAYYNQDLIGTIVTLCYKDRVIDWYAGSNKENQNKNPNDLLPWRAFIDAKNSGYKIFDFGGAGKPDVAYGVRDYKKKFGGSFIELNRYKKIHKPFLMSIGKLGLNFFQKLR